MSGFEVIKSYGMKRYALSRFEKSSIQTINAKYSVDKTAAANDALSMLLAVFLQVVVIFLSAYFIMTGRVTPGVLLGMTQASGNLANPLLMILGSIPKTKKCEADHKTSEEFVGVPGKKVYRQNSPFIKQENID